MKILSFDIGIRNLAYCIYDHDPISVQQKEENIGEIVEWNVIDILTINLSEKDQFIATCQKRSKKELQEWLEQQPPYEKVLKTKSKQELIEDIQSKFSQPQPGSKPTTKAKTKAKTNNIENYADNLLRWLESQPHLLECDVVALENQPCMTNPIMKSIQMIIYTYFFLKGIVLKPENRSPLVVKMISATNKLKIKPKHFKPKESVTPVVVPVVVPVPVVAEEGEPKVASVAVVKKGKTKYNDRKALSNQYVEHYMHYMTNESWLPYWKQHKKRDDLSDCLLQAVYVQTSNT